MSILFNQVILSDYAKEILNDCINTGHFQADGKYTDKVIRFFHTHLSIEKIVLTTSCSHALEAALWLKNIKQQEEVIMPSFNFPSAPNAVLLHRGLVKFCDISLDTLCPDENDMLNRITPLTKAIIPLNYGGISCDLDLLVNAQSDNREWIIIEDSAQCVFSQYKNRYLGTIGDMGCFSFHGTKNIQSGEGGALILNHPDIPLEKAQNMVQKGTNRHQFIQGQTSFYTWVDVGSSYTPSDLLMALLYSQLLEYPEKLMIREQAFNRYQENLSPYIGYKGFIAMTKIPKYNISNHHLFYIRLDNQSTRNQLMKQLKDRNIDSRFHFMPLHQSPMGQRLGYRLDDFPNSRIASETLLRLPLHNHIQPHEVDYVSESIIDILKEL